VSGGGTVYHDLGNVNFSFFSGKRSHCPPSNLAFLSGVLNERYNLSVHLNKRHDLYIEDSKISGSASRLIRHGAFHHCTLLVDSDLAALHGLLKGDTSIETSATSSLSSPTTSLCQAQSRDIVTTSRDDLKTSRNTATSSHDTLVVPRDVIDHVAESYLSLYDGTQTDRVGEWSGNQDCDNSVIIVNQVPDNAKKL